MGFAKGSGLKPVVMMSSMGTTVPNSPLDTMGNGQIGFYKLNSESFLMASGLPFTIVKPCGLGSDAPGKAELLVGHDDSEGWNKMVTVQRSDVARVVAAAVSNPQDASGLRFDLCAKAGTPTTDAHLPALLKSAAY